MNNRILYISLGLNIILSAWLIYFIVAPHINFSATTETIDRKEVESRKIFNDRLNEGDILFLGANRVHACDWNSLWGVRNICNAAFPSNSIIADYNRLEILLSGVVPNQIFIMHGETELLANKPVNKIVEDYKMLISKVKELLPQTEVVVLSPVPLKYYDVGDNKIEFAKNFKNLGLMLKLVLQDMGVSYINLESDFLGEDKFLKANFNAKDKLAINAKAYEIIKDRMKPYILN